MAHTPPTSRVPDNAQPQSELEFITELCSVVAEQSELQPILDWLVDKSARLLSADECSIKLLSESGNSPLTVSIDHRREHEAGTRTWSRAMKEQVMGYLFLHPGELATANLRADARFPALRNELSSTCALLAAPLKVDGRITGMIAASNTQPGREWSRHDVQLLTIVASHSASVIEKARLRAEAEEKERLKLEREAMEKELHLAHDLQMRLVPELPAVVGRWQAEGRLVPARQVGGDFFDYFTLDGDRAALVIADVAGKGYPAALLVSTVQASVRAFAQARLSPRELVTHLNQTVIRSAADGKFVTLFYAELDCARDCIRYVNAGHNHPRVRRADGTLAVLAKGGYPLGIFEDAIFEEGQATLGPDDALLMFSDGIPDTNDSLEQDFGEDRLDKLWREQGGSSTSQFLKALMSAVSGFRGRAAQNDDQTVLVIAPTGRG